jgi:cyclopropane-fatty-acyl-phospholipid synthase
MQVSAHEERKRLLSSFFKDYSGPQFAIRLWDGWGWYSSQSQEPICTIEVKNPHALRLLLANPDEARLGESFVQSDLDVNGDIFSVFSVAEHVLARPASVRGQLLQRLSASIFELSHLLRNGRRHSPGRDRSSIAHHYDQPFEFYRAWLGNTLTYSCAYFKTAEESLDQAQENKIDLICRKLRLQAFEQFLDIGCGWGGLILRAATEYGAYAHGITLSNEQERVCSSRINEARLTQSCKVELRDYRTLRNVSLPFDKIASVGMFEHVGLNKLAEYFGTVRDALKPGGVFLNHGIARSHQSPARKSSFIDRFVFPDGKLVTLAEAIAAAESAGFEVRDVENLREHYELTLRCWVRELQRSREAVLKYVSDSTYRTWVLYMAGSAAAFRRGDIGVYQVLLGRPDRGQSRLPLTREDWYVPASCDEAIEV